MACERGPDRGARAVGPFGGARGLFGELVQQRAALSGEVAQLVAVGAAVGLERREVVTDLDQRGELVGVRARIRFTAATATVGLRSAFTAAASSARSAALSSRASASRAAVNSLGSVAKRSSSRASRSRSGIRLRVQRRLALEEVRIEVVPGAPELVADLVGGQHQEGACDSTASATRVPATSAVDDREVGRTQGELLADRTHVLDDVRHHPGGREARHADTGGTQVARTAARRASSPRPCSRRRACGRRSTR